MDVQCIPDQPPKERKSHHDDYWHLSMWKYASCPNQAYTVQRRKQSKTRQGELKMRRHPGHVRTALTSSGDLPGQPISESTGVRGSWRISIFLNSGLWATVDTLRSPCLVHAAISVSFSISDATAHASPGSSGRSPYNNRRGSGPMSAGVRLYHGTATHAKGMS